MAYGSFLYNNFSSNLRQLIRKYEAENKKLIKNKLSYKFNYTCLKENILPKYSNILNMTNVSFKLLFVF